MKRTIAVLLTLLLVLSLTACGGGNQTAPATPEPTPQSAKDVLNENERLLFDAIIKFTSSEFHNPSSARVLEIGDYQDNTKYDKKSENYGTAIVVVRLQGDNQAGGTINCNYVVCIRAAEPENKASQARYELAISPLFPSDDKKIEKLRIKAEFAEFELLSDDYKIDKDASGIFSVSSINKAIKEYWDDMGF
jgi:hypothetical protein